MGGIRYERVAWLSPLGGSARDRGGGRKPEGEESRTRAAMRMLESRVESGKVARASGCLGGCCIEVMGRVERLSCDVGRWIIFRRDGRSVESSQ